MDSSNGTKSLSIPIETFEPKISFLIIFLDESVQLSYSSYDVINCQLKREFQKRQKMEISRVYDRIQIYKVGKCLWQYYRFCYFLRFLRKSSKGQEIVHMIKSARNGNLDILIWFFFVFSLWLLFIEFRILLLFHFFRFRVTWPGNRVRRNLPIDFEILIQNFEPLYGMLYIKRKHVICRTQKHAVKSNS